jgi:phosphoglycerol transferase MdoB-like AlkP superfamily enzyme
LTILDRLTRPAGDGASGDGTFGRDQFALAFLLAVAGWLACVILQVALYVRPAPHGGAFLAEWDRYFGLAVYYDMLGVWLLSLPFFLLWLAVYRRRLESRWWRVIPALQAALLTLNLALSQVDHEILRFLGVRLNLSYVHAYGKPRMVADGLFLDVMRSDQGGAYLPLVLLVLVPGLYLWWAVRRMRRGTRRSPVLWLAILLAIVPLAAPANGWRMATSQFRLRKVEPVVLAFATDIAAGYEDLEAPADYDRLVADYRRDWLARSADKGWRFPDPDFPYLRVPTGPASAPPAQPWNVIYLQLETLRGMDTGFLRPELARSPTPYLDRLARRPDSAVWTRTLSFGMPSINGIFATHCSVTPPSRRYVTTLTHVEFLCLPELLRRRGYRAEMFRGDDTDWDNSTRWFRRWYDRLWRYSDDRRQDRELFRRAAARIRALGRSGRPFFAALVSAGNHTPFTSPEPAMDIAGHDRASDRILNTTHYTDDVVRELVEGLRGEPWFDRTLIVITGDHGFNVGEHGQIPGQHNLYRESVWVPLIIAGAHPRLRPGRHDDPASLLDLPPTLADLLGVREANHWQGHNLLAVNGGGVTAFGFRESLLAETPSWSAVRDPQDGEARLFDSRRDWLQSRDLARRFPDLARRLLERAERSRRLNDYLLRQGRVWRSSAS